MGLGRQPAAKTLSKDERVELLQRSYRSWRDPSNSSVQFKVQLDLPLEPVVQTDTSNIGP